MKKLLTILSSLICSLVVSQVVAQPYGPSSQTRYPCYADRCVGRCQDSCVGQCVNRNENGGDRFYVGAFGGANWLHVKHSHDVRLKNNPGYTGAVSAGYKFNNGFRVEGEAAYRRNHVHAKNKHDNYDNTKAKGHVSTFTYMGNVLYDFDAVSNYVPNVVPYVGVGVGYGHQHVHVKAKNEYEHVSAKGKDSGFVAQGIAGVGYRLTDSTTLGVEYRYLMGKEPLAHSVGVSLRQSF